MDYGYVYGTHALSPSDFAQKPKPKAHHSSLVPFLRIFATVIEIGAMIGLSVLTGGATAAPTAAMLAAEVGIGLAGATAQTGISAMAGEISGLSVGIDYATAFIPLGSQTVKSLKISRNVGKLFIKESEQVAIGATVEKATASDVRSLARAQASGEKWAAKKSAVNWEERLEKKVNSLHNNRMRQAHSIVNKSNKMLKSARHHEKRLLNEMSLNQKKMNMLFKNGDLDRLTEAKETQVLLRQSVAEQTELASDALAMRNAGYQRRLYYNNKYLQKYGITLESLSKHQDEWIEYYELSQKILKEKIARKTGKVKSTLSDKFEQVHALKFTDRLNSRAFLNKVESIGGKEYGKLLKEVYKPATESATVRGLNKAKVTSKIKFESLLSILDEETANLLRMAHRKVSFVKMSKSDITELLDRVFEASEGITGSKLSLVNRDTIINEFLEYGTQDKGNILRRFVKYAGSSQFNEKWVQRAQLIDPNDVGRYPVELLYQKLRSKITKRLEEKEFNAAFKEADAVVKDSKDLQEAFVKSGGKLIKSKKLHSNTKFIASRYILGIKKMPGGTPMSRLVLVKFNKLYTAAKGEGYKNSGGKKDVLVTMSDNDFNRMLTEGTDYWWRVGRRKGWYVSRGGKRALSHTGALSTELSLFLGFAPVPALRNVFSIVSNWVENIQDMVQGNYVSNYIPKFERAFVRSLINRTARLTSRVLIGGAYAKAMTKRAAKLAEQDLKAGKIFTQTLKNGTTRAIYKTNPLWNQYVRQVSSIAKRRSQWVGRELQRMSTNVLSTFEGKNKKGYFAFTDGHKGNRSGGKALFDKLWQTAAPTAIKGEMLRNATRKGNTRARQFVGANRYTKQLFRAYSTFTPSGHLPSLRKATRIYKK